ncbi:MAG: hypothetical protein H6835_13845 [Planctomycetes bacterium]|nr:hypothetical protein [Planctomycetota bacterium]
MNSSLKTLLLGAGFGAAFLLGQWFAPTGGVLGAQGRGPVNAPVAPDAPEPQPTSQIVYTEDGGGGGSSSGNGFLAVTGSYGVGTSVLYLIDTVSRQLAVYEARGGSAEQRRIVLVGARRIDLDLQLHGYNDRSEYEYADLQRLFEKRDGKDRKVRTGLEPAGADK